MKSLPSVRESLSWNIKTIWCGFRKDDGHSTGSCRSSSRELPCYSRGVTFQLFRYLFTAPLPHFLPGQEYHACGEKSSCGSEHLTCRPRSTWTRARLRTLTVLLKSFDNECRNFVISRAVFELPFPVVARGRAGIRLLRLPRGHESASYAVTVSLLPQQRLMRFLHGVPDL